MKTPSASAATAGGLVVLISGRGSNLAALIEAQRRGELGLAIVGVISNFADAPGLEHARRAQIPTQVIDHRRCANRADFDRALAQGIADYAPRLVALAGFMRILGAEFVDRFRGRLINIHPSLLPRYKGLNTHARALADNAREHGASVHFVTLELDGGPVIAQARVPVLASDDADTLAARVLAQEHRLYPWAVRQIAAGAITLGEDDSLYYQGRRLSAPLELTAPPAAASIFSEGAS